MRDLALIFFCVSIVSFVVFAISVIYNKIAKKHNEFYLIPAIVYLLSTLIGGILITLSEV